MGAFDISLPVSAATTDLNAFLGGLGGARQQAGAQQAQLNAQSNMAQQQAWGNAIQQGAAGLRPLMLAPFIPQLAQLPPAQQMIAGSLLGLPGLQQAGFQQAGFQNAQALQSSQFAGYSNLRAQDHAQAYQDLHGFSPDQGPQIGQQLIGGMPQTDQVATLSMFGTSPQQLAQMPQEQQQVVYRRVAEYTGQMQRAQQAGQINATLQAAQAEQFATQQAVDGIQSGNFEITDPTWKRKWQSLNQGYAEAVTDENLVGPVQQRFSGMAQQERAQLVRQMRDAGVLRQKVDPVDANIATTNKIASNAKAQGLKSFWVPGLDGKMHQAAFADEVDTSKWSPEQISDYVQKHVVKTEHGPVFIQPGGKIEPWKTGGEEGGIEYGKILDKVLSAQSKEGGDVSAAPEMATKLYRAAHEERQKIEVERKKQEAFRSSPIGQVVSYLEEQSPQDLYNLGVFPDFADQPDHIKRRVAEEKMDQLKNAVQKHQTTQAVQDAVQTANQATQQLGSQALNKAANAPMNQQPLPGQGATPLQETGDNSPQTFTDPLQVPKKGKRPIGTLYVDNRGTWEWTLKGWRKQAVKMPAKSGPRSPMDKYRKSTRP